MKLTRTITLVSTLLALTCTSPAWAQSIVEFDASQDHAKQNIDLSRNFETTTGDFDGDADKTDTKVEIAFSDTAALSPSKNYTGQNFYGGIERIFFDEGGKPDGLLARINGANPDKEYINLRVRQKGNGTTRQTALILFKKEDFKANGATGTVSLDSTSSFQVAFQAQTYGGTSVRAVVVQDGIYYVSEWEDVYKGDMTDQQQFELKDPADVKWAEYDPKKSLFFDGSVFNPQGFTNVEAVGFLLSRDVTTDDSFAPNLHWLISNMTVEAAVE